MSEGPLVGLLGQDGADRSNDGLAVGKDAHHVGAPADLLVEPLLGVVGAILGQCSTGEALKARTSSAASSRKLAASVKPVSVSFETTSPSRPHTVSRSGCSNTERTKVATIGHDAFGTRLAKFAMKCVLQRCQLEPESTVEMAALMPAVGVGDDELHAMQPPGHERAQEGRPAGGVLGRDDVEADDLATSLAVDGRGDHRRDVHHSPSFTDLLGEGVDPQIPVRTVVERALSELATAVSHGAVDTRVSGAHERKGSRSRMLGQFGIVGEMAPSSLGDRLHPGVSDG